MGDWDACMRPGLDSNQRQPAQGRDSNHLSYEVTHISLPQKNGAGTHPAPSARSFTSEVEPAKGTKTSGENREEHSGLYH